MSNNKFILEKISEEQGEVIIRFHARHEGDPRTVNWTKKVLTRSGIFNREQPSFPARFSGEYYSQIMSMF